MFPKRCKIRALLRGSQLGYADEMDMKRISAVICWVIWDFSGIRFLYEKILPSEDSNGYRKPSTFIFWIIGTYVAFLGVASQRYENRIDVIENKTTAILAQLATDANSFVISRIPAIPGLDHSDPVKRQKPTYFR